MTFSSAQTIVDPNYPSDELGILLSEFTARIQRGEQLSVDDFADEHPQFADHLRNLLPTAHALLGLGRAAEMRNPAIGPQFSVLGDFQLQREIGRGGMGIVHEARQISLDRRVAVKIFPLAGILNPCHLQRFQNEARAAAMLDHPHIVHVHAVGQDRGVHFYAMQLIEGQSLAELLEHLREPQLASCETTATRDDPETKPGLTRTACSRLTTTVRAQPIREYFARVAQWGIDAAEALDHAHQMGIVHRDIKPSNLLINAEGRLWVTDFGLAMTRTELGLTMTGDLLGTLRYMSPEQILGKRGIIDQRTDVYSLGITLYELLALRPAFDMSDRAELLRCVELDDPPCAPLRTRSVPIELELIIYKAINKDAAARYATAQALADDLRRFLNDQPIRARPPTGRDLVLKWSRRHRTLVQGLAIGGCLSLLMAIFAMAFVMHARHLTALERVARQVERVAADAAYRNQNLHRYVTRINLADRAMHRGEMIEGGMILNDSRPESDQEDLRGFEWHYLSNVSNYRIREIGRHSGIVYGVVPSSDSKLLASFGQDGIRIWSVETGRQERTVTGHSGDVTGASFSPDGRFFASAGEDGTAKIWNTQSWSVVATLQHTGPAGGGGFSPDGQLFMTGERQELVARGDTIPESTARIWTPERWTVTPHGVSVGENVIRVWETRNWTEQAVLRGHEMRLQAGDGSDDGRLLATADLAGIVNLWQMPNGNLLRTLQHNPNAPQWAQAVRHLDLAHHHPWMATIGHGDVHLWNTQDGSPVARLPVNSSFRCVAFSPDDAYLLAASHMEHSTRGHLHVWGLTESGSYEEMAVIKFPSMIWSFCFLAPRELAVACQDGRVYRAQIPQRMNEVKFQEKVPETQCFAAISPDGRWLARSGSQIVVQSLQDLNHQISLDTGPGCGCPLIFAPDGQQLFAAQESVCKSWNTNNWEPASRLTYLREMSGIRHLRFHASHLLSVQDETKFQHWVISKDQFVPDARGPRTQQAAYSQRSGRTIRQTDPEIWGMFDPMREYWRRRFPQVRSFELSEDGAWLAVVNADGSIEMFDATSGTPAALCIGSKTVIQGLAFSGDNKTLAGFSDSNSQVTFWQVTTGRELLTIDTRLPQIRSLAFTPDNKWLIVAGQNAARHGEVILIPGDMAK